MASIDLQGYTMKETPDTIIALPDACIPQRPSPEILSAIHQHIESVTGQMIHEPIARDIYRIIIEQGQVFHEANTGGPYCLDSWTYDANTKSWS
jgi:hypothetical protein